MGLPVSREDSGLNVDRRDLGRADSFRFNVMTFVVEENYDRAIKELKDFFARPSEYPQFQDRIERYVNHAVDLVNAIRAKRRFPGINSLTMSKQQELTEKYHEHFGELQYVLKKIEKIQVDLRQEDVRSTAIILKAFVNALFAIAVVYFVLELSRGLFQTGVEVLDDAFIKATDAVFKMIGF